MDLILIVAVPLNRDAQADYWREYGDRVPVVSHLSWCLSLIGGSSVITRGEER